MLEDLAVGLLLRVSVTVFSLETFRFICRLTLLSSDAGLGGAGCGASYGDGGGGGGGGGGGCACGGCAGGG